MSVTNAFHAFNFRIYIFVALHLSLCACGGVWCPPQTLLRNGADVKFYVVVGQDARATHLKTYTLEV